MKKTILLFAVFAIFAGILLPCTGAEFALIKDGKSACVIVKPAKDDRVTDFAATELAEFLGRISKGEKPAIIKGKNSTKLYPVIFNVDAKAETSGEGYIISVNKNAVTITSKHPRGIMYGVYALLKDSTGIRWVYPGADGEYFKVQKTIKVKEGVKKAEPSFPYRGISFHAMGVTSPVKDTRNWMVRNNLQLHAYDFQLSGKYKDLAKILADRGAYLEINPGFSNIFSGTSYAKAEKVMAEWFKKESDKELFPLINGKRTFLKGQAYQPCTSHPETIRRSTEGLINYCVKPTIGRDGVVQIYNNDGTGWCQCDNCKKLDSAYDKKMGYVSDRFWHYVQTIGKKALEKYPDAKINGVGYQNFEAPPSFQIDKRFGATLSFNRLCYRHKVDDPDCLLNPKFLNFYKGWKKQGIYIIGREEISGAGTNFQPVSPNYVYLLKFYKKMGFAGNFIAIAPPDGNYNPRRKSDGLVQWRSMWQTMYFHAIYTWNINADYNKEWEEMNSLYYGKAWNGGMRDFYKLLWEASSTTPGCFGHGYSAPLGRCLDKPMVQEKLNKYLAAALKAAEKDPDKRALAHVKFDAKRFKDTWEYQRKHYLANYRELRAYEKTSPIKIDGVLDDKDWKNADIITNFKNNSNVGVLAEQQTFARVVYEPEYFYFAAEMVEPAMDKVYNTITKRDGPVWEDNTLELFLTHPDLGGTFFHFIFNTDGVFYDRKVYPGEKGDSSFNSSLQVKTRRLADRWVLEAKIPTAELGEKCFTGQSWKMNVMRARKLIDTNGEGSTLTGGKPFDTATFLSIAFSGKRFVNTAKYEGDSRQWKNGSLNEPAKKIANYMKGLNIENNVLPSSWDFKHLTKKNNALVSWRQFPESSNWYIHLKNSAMMNGLYARGEKYRVNLKYRGKGSATFYVLRYPAKKGIKLKNPGSKIVHKIQADTKDWTYAKFDFAQPGEAEKERQVFGIWVNGEVDFDEVYLAPVKK
ncbi:MAG: DUF4838 domain-containing protein [Lentisphaeria bacterium]|nr:DUF4838 domain-containing protein [Lentisphaeria bacterium]